MERGICMFINIDYPIKCILDLIMQSDFDAYVVGGYLRDKLLNIDSFDVDITTNARPNELLKIFKNFNVDSNFINLGCVKFCFEKYNFEITTFREEFNYINHRKPSKIKFVNELKDDLIRRDFTINAVCSDGIDVIDLFNGLEDLKNKTIKTIGNSQERFEEDSLRILRALRFSSKLGFSLEYVDKAIINNYKYLDLINFDVKYKELKGILGGNNYIEVLSKYKDILMEIFCLNLLNVELFNIDMSYEEREALFFYFSENNINNKYLLNRKIEFINDKIDLKKKLKVYGKEIIENLLYFRNNILNTNKEDFIVFSEIIDNKECYNLKMLNINGKDLLNINIKKNKIGKNLNMLLDAVIENKCLNEKKALLNYLKDNILD